MRKVERIRDETYVCESSIPSMRAVGEHGSGGSICAIESRSLAVRDENDEIENEKKHNPFAITH